ncbi:ABC transporter substrate-binding protein [Pseudorhodoferax sp. Leaf274]|uniref:ABC transporter substrate-binding protein n=1 Tax=Pseudorhodoferax sp. Leaf274 TaxID=1736318 RepID=UPI0007025E87|nr:ABC transporter substrate-binding protein [Pseudorhodoferax sp. Leaf274]KQP47715.1 ABC transporter substrate-binding protein [Pseudorhodoferax sp. Leaf274]
MTRPNRRAFLRSSSAATVLAGVPAWALLEASSAMAQTSTADGTLTAVLNPEPPVLVSFSNTAGTSVTVSSKVLEGLLEYSHDLTPRPQLATSWTVSPDGLEYLFKLREGVKWHDGKPFVAADAAFSILLSKRYHPRGTATFANLAAAEAVDARTLRLKLSKPAPYLLLALSAGETPILPSHRYDAETAVQNPLNAAPIGTGPFRFKQWERGSHIIYERNPDYWQPGKPKVQQLVFRIIPDIAARLNGFQNKSIDLGESSPIPLSEVPKLGAYPHLATSTVGYEDNATITMLEFNLERPVFQKPEVRQAIAHAISREQIRNIAFYGYAVPTVAPVSKSSFPRFHLDVADPYPYDVEKANRLLDAAGYPRKGSAHRFELTIHANPFGEGFKRTAHYVRSALARVGINVIVREQDPGSYVRSVYTDREFDFTVSGVSTMFDPTVGLQRIYWSKSFNTKVPWSNANKYQNPEVDRLLEAAAIETDAARRADLFKQFQAIVVKEIPSIALVQTQNVTVYNKRVDGFNLTAAGLRGNIADVQFKDV